MDIIKEDPDTPQLYILEKQCEDKGMRISGFDKTLIAVVIGIVFFVLMLPFVFKLSNTALRPIGVTTTDSSGRANLLGMLLHVTIGIVVIRLLMH